MYVLRWCRLLSGMLINYCHTGMPFRRHDTPPCHSIQTQVWPVVVLYIDVWLDREIYRRQKQSITVIVLITKVDYHILEATTAYFGQGVNSTYESLLITCEKTTTLWQCYCQSVRSLVATKPWPCIGKYGSLVCDSNARNSHNSYETSLTLDFRLFLYPRWG